MGLDITAYSSLKHIGRHTKEPAHNEGEPGGLDDWCYYTDHVQAFAYALFPQSFRGLPILAQRNIGRLFDKTPIIDSGCFETTPDSETHDFRAGSYDSYNQWRADLRQLFNPLRLPELPFYELIWFADNEGSIGPEAAADLLADFHEHADAYANAHPASFEASYSREKYADWTRAFELAANRGLVRFH